MLAWFAAFNIVLYEWYLDKSPFSWIFFLITRKKYRIAHLYNTFFFKYIYHEHELIKLIKQADRHYYFHFTDEDIKLWVQFIYSNRAGGWQCSSLIKSCPSIASFLPRDLKFNLFITLIFLYCASVAQSCPTLQSLDCSPPGSSVHGILQGIILEWVAIPFSRGFSRPRDRTQSPAFQVDSFPSEPPGKPSPIQFSHNYSKKKKNFWKIFNNF